MGLSSVMKVPDGKLIKIMLDLDEDKIKSIKITGDFFAHPEDIIEKIEQAVIGMEMNKEALFEGIKKTVEENKANLFGIDPENIAKAIMMCLEKK